MIKYSGALTDYTFPHLKRYYPTAQELIFKALCALTPEKLGFEISVLGKGRTFRHKDGIDQDTYDIVSEVMTDIMGNDDLIMTRDDLIISYLRFKELIFIDKAMKQGLIVPKIEKDRIDYYYTVGPDPLDEESDPKPETDGIVRARSIYRYRNFQ